MVCRMKRMTLQEIQKVNLDIMKDIHCYCVEKGIHYSLAYGSLIGAVRHKGFIPWDDDIDIMMTRPDFEVFSKEFRSKKGFELSSVYNNDTFVNYTRVYDNRTVATGPLKASKHQIGVWVDVFPIDAIPDDLSERNRQFQRLRRFTSLIRRLRVALSDLEERSLLRKITGFLRLVKLAVGSNGLHFDMWHNQVISICKEYTFGETMYCSSMVCFEATTNNRQEVFPTSAFKSYKILPFENEFFYVIDSYDSVLTTIFGDYMKLPPEEKRVSHSLKNWSYYWK